MYERIFNDIIKEKNNIFTRINHFRYFEDIRYFKIIICEVKYMEMYQRISIWMLEIDYFW